ncbi:hypothetical protein MRX96_049275 [Rhipicephalus microplus]
MVHYHQSHLPFKFIVLRHPTLEGLQAAKSLAISLIQTAHTDFAEWQQQQLAALTFQSAMALPGATQQLASATPVITGLGQVFQPVATAGEVQAQGFLVSPGVMGGPVSIHYGTHFTSHAFKVEHLPSQRPLLLFPSTNTAVPLPTDTSVPPPNMAVPSLASVPPPSKVEVHTAVVPPANAAVALDAAAPLPADTTMPPPTNAVASPPPATDTSVPPPNFSASDGWRFRVPPPPVTARPPLFPSASASSSESVRASLPPKPSTSPPLSRSYATHSDAKTAEPTPSSPASSSSSSITPLYYRSLRPQAKSSYLSSYQASALTEEEFNSYGKPASRTNGSSLPSMSVTGAADTSTRLSAESTTKKSDWEIMPPPSQTKPASRISSMGTMIPNIDMHQLAQQDILLECLP